MPRHYLATGQSSCWDAGGRPIPCPGSGQDGELRPGTPWPTPRFIAQRGVVRDRLTGLDWLGDASPFEWPLTWWETLDRVATLNSGHHHGHSDWRLPNRRELSSLICYRAGNPALPPGHPFQGVQLVWYWSSTTAARNASYAWCVQLTGGRVFFEHKHRYAFAWPCRGDSEVVPETGQRGGFDRRGRPHASGSDQDGDQHHGVRWPTPRFEPSNGAVLDRLTGLLWCEHADAATGPTDWEGALSVVRGACDVGGGARRWRLPTIHELDSLVDASRHDPSLPAGHRFGRVRNTYWSSTTSTLEADWAMVLHLGRGAVGVGFKADPTFWVWPVAER